MEIDSRADPTSMFEVPDLCEPDLREVERKRPEAVEPWFPPEVPKTPSAVASCEPKFLVEMPADWALRSEPTPVSSGAEPPIVFRSKIWFAILC